MQVIVQPDAPPATLSTLTPDQQATKLFQLYTGMAEYAGTCTKSRDNLILWINRQ
jgi:hypothetical protein